MKKWIYFYLLFFFTCKVTVGQITFDPVNAPALESQSTVFLTGVSWVDIDNDLDLDIVLSGTEIGNPAVSESRIVLNECNGESFSFSDLIVSNSNSHWGNGGADIDNDGDVDIYFGSVTNFNGDGISELWLNQNGSSFTNVTNSGATPNVAGEFEGTISWGDYNADGFVDLFLAQWIGKKNIVYKNNGDGTFVAVNLGLLTSDTKWTSGGIWGDYDNDNDLDIFVTNNPGPNDLFENNGDGTFTKNTTAGEIVNNADARVQSANWVDVNNDGWMDLFCAAGAVDNNKANNIHINNGDGTFSTQDLPLETDFTISSNWGDFDNDGDEDLITVGFGFSIPGAAFYENDGSGQLTNITNFYPNVAPFFSGSNGGIAFVDFNNDGWLDLHFLGNGSSLHRNSGNSSNSWLKIKCEGTTSNRSAIGTTIRAKTTINGNEHWQMRQISAQTSRTSQNPTWMHFGFGTATTIDSLVFEWPTGQRCVFTDVATNQFIEVIESCALNELTTHITATNEIEICQSMEDTLLTAPSGVAGGTWSSSCTNCLDVNGLFSSSNLNAGEYEAYYTSCNVRDTIFISLEADACADCAGTVGGMAILDNCGACLEPSDPLFNQSCADCAGVVNGSSILDNCGECLEPTDPMFNQSCADCAGVVNGLSILDNCGECLEPTDPIFNQSCADCAGVVNGLSILDNCGECLEPTDPMFNQSCADCAGVVNGSSILDICGECLEPTDPMFNQSCADCAGVVNGLSILDNCGECLGPTDPMFNQSCTDCAGVVGGSSILDNCGECLESTDPLFNQSCTDCAGVIGGSSILDNCGECLEPSDPMFNQSCADCAGVVNGLSILDNCGACLEPTDPLFNQSCADCAGVVNGSSILDNCGECLEPTDPMFNQSCADCAGVVNGLSILDNCGECLDPTDPLFNQSCADCAGVVNGLSILDNCGECLEPSDPIFNQSCADCAGVVNGLSMLDNCGECLELTDPMFNQSCADCAGVLNGLSILDNCGECLEPTDPMFNQSCIDCAGVVNGLSILDNCGECLEPSDPMFNLSCLDQRSVFIPNIFSPNGDGINDLFQIYPVQGVESSIKEYLIFDRWGALMYQINDVAIATNSEWWDGIYKGQSVQSGVYVYYIEIEFQDGEVVIFNGDITVLN